MKRILTKPNFMLDLACSAIRKQCDPRKCNEVGTSDAKSTAETLMPDADAPEPKKPHYLES